MLGDALLVRLAAKTLTADSYKKAMMDSGGTTNRSSATKFHGEFADREQSPCAGHACDYGVLPHTVLRTGNSR